MATGTGVTQSVDKQITGNVTWDMSIEFFKHQIAHIKNTQYNYEYYKIYKFYESSAEFRIFHPL